MMADAFTQYLQGLFASLQTTPQRLTAIAYGDSPITLPWSPSVPLRNKAAVLSAPLMEPGAAWWLFCVREETDLGWYCLPLWDVFLYEGQVDPMGGRTALSRQWLVFRSWFCIAGNGNIAYSDLAARPYPDFEPTLGPAICLGRIPPLTLTGSHQEIKQLLLALWDRYDE